MLRTVYKNQGSQTRLLVNCYYMKVGRPSVYEYHDYRAFLRDMIAYHGRSKYLSLRKLAKKIGLSHGYFSLVLKEQRNLSEKALASTAKELGLKPAEVQYLSYLVQLADSGSAEDRNKAFRELMGAPKYKERHPEEFETYKYLENWVNVVIRELAQTDGFQADPKWIQKQIPFSVSIKEIEESLRFLTERKFLVPDANGRLVVAERDIKCVGGVYQLSLGNFHSNMLELARKGLKLFRRPQRKQIGYTLALAKEDFEAVRNILEEAKEKIKALEKKSSGKPSDTVYHINFSAFPLAGKGCSNDET